LACRPTSGTPRWVSIAELPAGRLFWKSGREKTWLEPPPEPSQPISLTPGFDVQFAGGWTLSTLVPVVGSVQRYVPPTPVTSGSEAGHSTVGNGIRSLFGLLPTRLCLVPFAVPPSPDDPSTVTPFVDACTNAPRRFRSDFVLLN